MAKKEMKSALSGFDMKGYLKKDIEAEKALEKQENNDITSEQEAEKLSQNDNLPKKAINIEPIIKKPKVKQPNEDKIAFMNYLPLETHDEFSHLLLKARSEIRMRTRKSLAQTELIEAIIKFTVENWSEERDRILNIAEMIINNRKSEE